MPSLFDDLATPAGERFDELLVRPGVVVERIVSTGQTTPADTPYDQTWDEWVLLISGAARLWLEDRGEIALAPGDHLLIPAHCRHLVLSTKADPPTIWLALHFRGDRHAVKKSTLPPPAAPPRSTSRAAGS